MNDDGFKLGFWITYCVETAGKCIDFLQEIVLDFGSFQFTLFDLSVAFIVLWLALSLIFPWFGEDDEED